MSGCLSPSALSELSIQTPEARSLKGQTLLERPYRIKLQVWWCPLAAPDLAEAYCPLAPNCLPCTRITYFDPPPTEKSDRGLMRYRSRPPSQRASSVGHFGGPEPFRCLGSRRRANCHRVPTIPSGCRSCIFPSQPEFRVASSQSAGQRSGSHRAPS